MGGPQLLMSVVPCISNRVFKMLGWRSMEPCSELCIDEPSIGGTDDVELRGQLRFGIEASTSATELNRLFSLWTVFAQQAFLHKRAPNHTSVIN